MSYGYNPNWTSGQVIRHASRWWNLISGVFMALCLGVVCLWIALGSTPPPVTSDVTPIKMYHIGDYGLGRPTYGTPWSDVGLCPGEVIYYPNADLWRCE